MRRGTVEQYIESSMCEAELAMCAIERKHGAGKCTTAADDAKYNKVRKRLMKSHKQYRTLDKVCELLASINP